MQDFHNLAVWHKAHSLAVSIHQMSARISRHGNSGFISQMRRAAESIPANIAEGCSRHSDSDFAKFIQIALGSNSELESHLKYAVDTELISVGAFNERKPEMLEVRRMLIGLLKKLDPSRFKNQTSTIQ
ncbi:MAG: four helix bundle protein, partial [Gemmatimonadaceae bacterium]